MTRNPYPLSFCQASSVLCGECPLLLKTMEVGSHTVRKQANGNSNPGLWAPWGKGQAQPGTACIPTMEPSDHGNVLHRVHFPIPWPPCLRCWGSAVRGQGQSHTLEPSEAPTHEEGAGELPWALLLQGGQAPVNTKAAHIPTAPDTWLQSARGPPLQGRDHLEIKSMEVTETGWWQRGPSWGVIIRCL